MLIHDKVIILRAVKHGEADLILHALNSKGTRLNFIAKSALKSRRRFGGGVLEPSHYLRVVYKKKNDPNDLMFLEEAEMVESFPHLREDYAKLEVALYFLQLVAQVSHHGNEDDGSLFSLLGNALRAAEKSERPEVLRALFELKLLRQQGVLPPELTIKNWLQTKLANHATLEAEDLLRIRPILSQALKQYLG
jgi:DNA repair protein RecO (recombination protein O)